MSVSLTHALHQGPVVRTILKTAVSSICHRIRPARANTKPFSGPGKVIKETVPPLPRKLVADYIRHVGGNPGWYGNALPPHLFPQWGFPLFGKVLEALPHDLARVLNAGCRLEIGQPLPAGEPLELEANLEEVDDNGERVIINQRLITGTRSAPRALIAEVQAILPRKKKGGPKREKPRVPLDARELGRWKLAANSGFHFALLTGDFNPIHWIAPYARLAGFRNTILHGFSVMARSVETFNGALWSGQANRLKSLEVRFVRPLVLPARVGLFIDEQGGMYVGPASGGPACLVGRYESSRP